MKNMTALSVTTCVFLILYLGNLGNCSDTNCEDETGNCTDCPEGAEGPNCETCKEGFYGDPRNGVHCRECPCPNTKASGHSFADRCYLDPDSFEPICDCKEGYAGNRCSICDDNFFGNPEDTDGSCNQCFCSGNWMWTDSGNCDSTTGICLKCRFYTTGDHCESCAEGFWGDALLTQCQECTCNLLGTDQNSFACDETTGQCHCLPNVEGKYCEKCIVDHWKLASGEGCEPCGCDPEGSLDTSCNEFTGQCLCKKGFGGQKCDKHT